MRDRPRPDRQQRDSRYLFVLQRSGTAREYVKADGSQPEEAEEVLGHSVPRSPS